MKFTAISYILFAKDADGLAHFYSKCFGFKRVANPAYKESQWLELAARRGFKLCLLQIVGPKSKP